LVLQLAAEPLENLDVFLAGVEEVLDFSTDGGTNSTITSFHHTVHTDGVPLCSCTISAGTGDGGARKIAAFSTLFQGRNQIRIENRQFLRCETGEVIIQIVSRR
jgi:hypothetical protein